MCNFRYDIIYNLKLLTLILSLFLSQLVYAQESTEQKFNNLLRIKPGDKLSNDHITSFFDTSSEPYDFVLFDSVVHKSETYLLISTTHKKNNKYRYQSSTFLSSFNLNGAIVDRIRVKGGLSDCSFSNYSALGLFDGYNLSVYTTKQEFDCGSETLLNRVIEVSEYEIQENGSFKKTRSRNVEPNRTNRWISLRLLSKDELNKLTPDSLAILRNEIFASYGYKFKSEEWKKYFSNTNWYQPSKNTVTNEELLLVERRNLKMIIQLEKKNYTQQLSFNNVR